MIRGLLLANEGSIALGIAVFLLIVVAGIIMSGSIKGKISLAQSKTKGAKFEGEVKVSVRKPFMPADKFIFYNAISRALPYDFIVFPKVGVSTILKSLGDNIQAFKPIGEVFVDFCIFKKETMEPVAVIDLIDRNASISAIMRQESAVTNALKSVNIPTLDMVVKDRYDEKELLSMFLDSQDPYTIALLKKGQDPKDFDPRRRA